MSYTAETIAARFQTRPFDHQLREFENNVEEAARALAWTMRTGKSKATIDKTSHLYLAGAIDGLLIFAPNGVHANWVERELPAHLWDGVPTTSLVWRTTVAGAKGINAVPKSERAEWAATQAAWWKRLASVRVCDGLMVLAVNTESMIRDDARKAVARFVKHRRVHVVFDESDDWGTPGSKRTKMARALARRCPFRTILSGTMLTGSPLAAFSQFELLEKGALGFETYEEFKDHIAVFEKTHVRGRHFNKVVGFKNLEDLRERMARFTSVVLREDCDDMPDLVPRVVEVEPSPQQLKAYRELHKTFRLEIDKRDVNVGERADRFRKMQQVFSGFVNDEAKKRVIIPGPNPRLEALRREVYLAPGKVIVWCEYQADIDFVTAALRKDGVAFVEYHGRVTDKNKAQALKTFRDDKAVKVFVGHVQSGGRGLDISVAGQIFNYSHTFKARMRVQSLERATKIGGANIEVVDFKAPGPDGYILRVTESRIDIADSIAGRGLRDLLKETAL